MATNIPVQSSGGTSATVYTLTPAASTMEFSNNGNTLLLIDGSTTPTGTVTIVSVPCSHKRSLNITQVIAAITLYVAGPFEESLFNDVNGKVQITIDTVTDISLAAIAIGR
ncbi:hypothetical protein LCGC14_0630230 [marine sediment metagenome]|uniref:Uncharacterized protein n=1 Tax=marine sediment metagenome TaxID=412755 RepID=A0A0F9R7D0_9ZZZZ